MVWGLQSIISLNIWEQIKQLFKNLNQPLITLWEYFKSDCSLGPVLEPGDELSLFIFKENNNFVSNHLLFKATMWNSSMFLACNLNHILCDIKISQRNAIGKNKSQKLTKHLFPSILNALHLDKLSESYKPGLYSLKFLMKSLLE